MIVSKYDCNFTAAFYGLLVYVVTVQSPWTPVSDRWKGC